MFIISFRLHGVPVNELFQTDFLSELCCYTEIITHYLTNQSRDISCALV